MCGKKYTKRWSTFVIRELQFKHYDKTTNYNNGFRKHKILIDGKDAEQQELSFIAGENVKCLVILQDSLSFLQS